MMNKTMLRVSALALAVAGVGVAQAGAPDWGKVPSKTITVLYPGNSGLEWIMKGVDHSGAKAVKANETCAGCHDKEAADIGKKIVTGQKLEPKPPKGKAGSIPVTVQAAHDADNLYLRFQWKAPAASGGPKLDAANQVKLTVMLDAGNVEYATQGACWATCHNDLRSMDDADNAAAKKHPKAGALGWNDGVTKYLKESRTELTIKDKPRGGWNKLKPDAEIAAALKEGKFLDLIQFRSGGAPVDGYVLDARHMGGGKALVSADGKNDGGTWTVTFVRKLAGGGTGDHVIAAGKTYHIGFAVHDDWANARYHQVSLGHTLALDDGKADINAVKQ
jgi:cytochrome c-type protein NapC